MWRYLSFVSHLFCPRYSLNCIATWETYTSVLPPIHLSGELHLYLTYINTLSVNLSHCWHIHLENCQPIWLPSRHFSNFLFCVTTCQYKRDVYLKVYQAMSFSRILLHLLQFFYFFTQTQSSSVYLYIYILHYKAGAKKTKLGEQVLLACRRAEFIV